MTLKTTLAAATVLALVAGAAGPLAAQTRRAAAPAATAARPAAAATPIQSGPPITGVCVFSFDRALASSAAGKAAQTRMQQLTAQVTAELQPEQTALQNDVKTFQAQRATLPADQQQSRGRALQTRADAYEQKAQLRQAELQQTGRKAQGRIGQEIEPILRSVYQGRNCSILLGDGVLVANPQMDVTEAVVAQLNAKLPTISFEREHLDQGAAAGR